MNDSRQALFTLHIAILLFGISGLFGKLLPIDPSWIVLGRTLVGSTALILILALTGKVRRLFVSGQWPVNVMLGSLLAAHWITFFQAIQVSSVAIGLLSFSSFPVFVTLLEPLLFRERLRWLDMLTATGVVAGLFIVFPLSSMNTERGIAEGVGWGILSAFLFAILSLANRSRIQKTDAMVLTCLQNIGAVITTLLVMPKVGVSTIADYWLQLLLLGLLCTTLPLMLFLNSLRYLKAQLVSLATCLEPVYGIVLAGLFLSEIPSTRTLLGGAVILGAITIGSLFAEESMNHG
ncbi:DMT family transporter [Endozoicomonas atrinae]|uniref:DMT family transporter n=1 Tax=Endozoicomonas atrinae TaxID=1333660 RepID=UPI00082565D2|nr:DMT family transporter [Endozoicomonas atrinae]